MGDVRRSPDDQPALITTAPQSNDDEFDRRKKRYAITMGLRALCVLLAALSYQVSFVLAMGFVIAGAVLPWCAVLIANDRPPKRRRAQLGFVSVPADRALPAGTDERVVDG